MEWKPICSNCSGEGFKPYPEYVRQSPDCYNYHVPLHQLSTIPNQRMEVVECCNCGAVYKIIPPCLERMITHFKVDIKIDI